MLRVLFGFILALGGVGGIETNTEVAIPLDSLGIALLGLGVMVWGVLSIVEIEEDSYE